jgi:hypothetical protein
MINAQTRLPSHPASSGQNSRIWTACVMTCIEPTAAQIGGDVRFDKIHGGHLSDTVLNDHRRQGSPNTGCPAMVSSPRPGGTDRRYSVELNWQPGLALRPRQGLPSWAAA